MMTSKEKEVFDLFKTPRTFEDAYMRSNFRGMGNFTSYVRKLKKDGLLTEFTRKNKNKVSGIMNVDVLLQAVKNTSSVYAGFCMTFIPLYFAIQFMR